MAVMTYEQLALSWKPDSKRDHIFNMIAVIVLAGFLVAGLIVSTIPAQKHKRDVAIPVPERVAKFITERPKVKPKQIPRVEAKPVPLPKPLFQRKKPELSKPLTKLEKKARKKAEDSGLLALTSQLSDLIDTKSVDKMVSGKIHRSSNNNRVATVNSTVLTANSDKGSGGVQQHVYTAGATASGATLDDNQLKLAKRLLASKGQIATVTNHVKEEGGSNKIRGDNLRAEEDVAYIMDKHKSVLHALYRRARRSKPGLKGKIILELTILPSGKVSKVRIVSSELNDSALEESLVARIKQFDFGARPVETLTVTIPVVFLPS